MRQSSAAFLSVCTAVHARFVSLKFVRNFDDELSEWFSLRISHQELHIHQDLASSLQDISDDALFASIGQGFRK